MLDSLFERFVVSQERIAAAIEKLPGAPSCAVAEATGAKRGRKPATTPAGGPIEQSMPGAEAAGAPDTGFFQEVGTALPAVEEKPAQTTAPATSSFLDDEPPAAPPVTLPKTVEEQRKDVRTALIALQKVTSPDQALKVLVASGGCDTLASLKQEKFADVLKAIAKATPPKAAA